jgi:hypothetical protein
MCMLWAIEGNNMINTLTTSDRECLVSTMVDVEDSKSSGCGFESHTRQIDLSQMGI